MNHCWPICLITIALCTGTATAQSSGQTREEQAFERFRVWISGQSIEVRGSAGISTQRDSELLRKYREFLKEARFSDAEIEAQIDVILKQSDRLEAERWNRYFTAEHPAFNTKPNAFLVEMVKGRTPGRALDVAMGQGRNAIWLAQQGWDVTGFDPADKAVAIANENAAQLQLKLHTEITTSEAFDFGENRWDLILLSYAGGGQLVDRIERALKPGGIVIVEAFHEDALKTLRIGGSLFRTGELPHIFQGLRSLYYEEPIAMPDFASRPVRIVRFCAQKPEPAAQSAYQRTGGYFASLRCKERRWIPKSRAA